MKNLATILGQFLNCVVLGDFSTPLQEGRLFCLWGSETKRLERGSSFLGSTTPLVTAMVQFGRFATHQGHTRWHSGVAQQPYRVVAMGLCKSGDNQVTRQVPVIVKQWRSAQRM